MYRDSLKNKTIDDVLEIFKRNIRVSPASRLGGDGVYVAVAFDYQDPRVAQQVTQALASGFVETEPDAFHMVEPASLPGKPTIPAFSAKFTSVGAAGGLLIGAPIAGILYWRRRRQT
jgi:hypothetical protein